MAYLGTPIDTRNTFQSLQGKRFNGDGSTTAFTLDVAPSSTLDIEVFVGNVRQDPNSAYTLSGTTLTFTGAPPSGTNNIYVVHQAKSVGTINPGANSVGVTELNLSDGSNGQFIKTDGSGTLSFGTVSSAADDITTGDSAVTIGTSSGDIKLDAAGDILLDADDTDILLQDGGSTFGGFKQVSSGLQISGGTTPSIVIDTSGRVTMSAQPTFMVSQTGSLSVANGHTLFSTNTTERWDVGSNLSGGTFTAPITGKYLLSYNMLYESVSDDSVFEDYIQTSNRSYAMWRNTRAYASNASYVYNAISVIADLDANDTAKVVHGGGSTATVHHSNGNWPWFQGWLLG